MIVTPCANRPVLQPCTLPDLNYQVDPYIGCGHCCHYCYVLPRTETDWKREILTHEDIDGRLASALSGIAPQTIYLGWHTDPYQPCEAEQRQTRRVLQLLLEKGFSAAERPDRGRDFRQEPSLLDGVAAGFVATAKKMAIEPGRSCIKTTQRKFSP